MTDSALSSAGPGARTGRTAATDRTRAAWPALSAVLLTSFLHLFDMTVVSVAAPAVRTGLGAGETAVQWVLVGYTMSFALFLVTAGRLGDAYGRRPLVLAGIVGFTLASAACAAAPNAGVLITARVVQGLSAALLAPQVAPVITLLFPKEKRGAAFGAQAAVVAVATTSGPLLGGLLVNADVAGLGWRSVFLVNLPVGVLALVLALRWLPKEEPSGAARIDPAGIAVASAALLMLLLPLVQGGAWGWPWWLVALAVAAPAVGWLLRPLHRRAEAAKRTPLIAAELFRGRGFPAGAGVNFLVMGGVAAFFMVFVVHLQTALDFSPKDTGLTLMPFALAAAVASGASVPLTGRLGRPMLEAGAFLMALGTGLLLWIGHTAGTDLSTEQIAIGLIPAGLGMGLVSPPLYNITLSAMPRRDIGSASGVFATFGQVGSSFGVALVGTVYYATSAGRSSDTAALDWALGCLLLMHVTALALLRFVMPRTRS
ncbi:MULTISPECIES: MFS transporter [unclassified Streptomyces]|uniref:MFS transporter n=1 Tax=unclassified Streptomyces TaxID=2593676 RepID=UPI0035D7F927